MPATSRVEKGRASFAQHAWRDAYDDLATADAECTLAAEDLDRLGVAAYLIGRDEDAVAGLERAHHGFLTDGEVGSAVRCAFWIGLLLFLRGRHAEGGGWLARAQHLVDQDSRARVERGYLLVPAGLQKLDSDPKTALDLFEQVAASTEGDDAPDLVALSRLGCGQALVALGEIERGTGMLDEAMLAVTTDDVSPITAGLVYCAVIITCRRVFDLRRAQEWTASLSRWCESQQDLKPYRGQCLVHRSEIMQLRGEWAAAMDEVTQACGHLSESPGDPVLGMAYYQRAELLRLRGELDAAEQAYLAAGESGHSVQPGLALLRMAQGRIADATAVARRMVDEVRDDTAERCRLLSAFVDIALEGGDLESARAMVHELTELAGHFDAPYLRAIATTGRGAIQLADGDDRGASATLHMAWRHWQELDAPFEGARVRVQIARVCRRLGDHDTARRELDAAGRVFRQLGAGPDVARVDRLLERTWQAAPGGLTAREVDVLRLVATGATNREVATRLSISEKTVARHLSNMFTKLQLSSRSAATAYAYQHDLV